MVASMMTILLLMISTSIIGVIEGSTKSSSSHLTKHSFVVNPSKVKQVSWRPRAFVYEGFLDDEECDHMISLAKSELKRSAVADSNSGKSKLSDVRTSSGAFITKAKDAIVERIEEKLATWTFLPKENGEDMQVLRYELGQKYDSHYDYFHDRVNIVRGGHRMITVLMYLSNVTKGGETVFPNAETFSTNKSSPAVQDDDVSECGKQGLSVKPKRGDALLFFSLYPNAVPDPSSLHGGCPVIDGEKWSATKWIHVDSFDKIHDDGCVDQHKSCERWAAFGECTSNEEYMVGTPNLPGYCRKSCKVC